ncbi:beta-amylase [Tritrichomonas musculus]|uniref:Beta-amylase n=1 Tax=Tritrichomonas musculus TaxID=1915356 RepID=A0ABR2GQZ1_9EUKA
MKARTENRCDVYVMAPLDIIDEEGKPSYIQTFTKWCKQLKEGGIDGVMIDVWWGLVEKTPKNYQWEGYDKIFKVMKKSDLKIVPVLSFHQCSGNIGDTANIPLPKFVFENKIKPYFVDKFNQINDEYISFSYDSVKLGERTPLEMYRDFMISFKQHFQKYISSNIISKIEVGLGPCGELRYPSYLLSRWEYPASGSFQCYDDEFLMMFEKDAKEAGHSDWTSPPSDTGDSYNELPGGPTFWQTGYKSDYGKFFLNWYSQKLIEHGRNVLKIAREVFPSSHLSGKVAGIHWQYLHESRCSEATAGYYNTNGNDGYSEIAKMFKENEVDFCFTCLEMKGKDKDCNSDPEGLVSDVFKIAAKYNLNFEGENAIESYDWDAYNQILKWASKGLKEFTFLRMTKKLMKDHKTWMEFVKFTKKMHSGSITKDDKKVDSFIEKVASVESQNENELNNNCL